VVVVRVEVRMLGRGWVAEIGRSLRAPLFFLSLVSNLHPAFLFSVGVHYVHTRIRICMPAGKHTCT